MVEGHQEADGAGPSIVAARGGPGALELHEPRHLLVQLEFGPVDLEVGGSRNALREDFARLPAAVLTPFREVDHRLLRAAQVERRPPSVHCLAYRAHVGVGVAVQQLQEQGEVLGIPLVWRRGQQQDMVGRITQQLAQLVALALVRFVVCGHPVGFVHDDQIPMHLAQARQDVVAFRQVQ